MSWANTTTGTLASGSNTIGTEATLYSPTANGTYEYAVDLSNLANGDVVELRIYKALTSGGTAKQVWKASFANAQVNAIAQSPPVPLPYGGAFSLKQIAGTARAFGWEVSGA